ncbi:hypothetical protein BK120_23625 [Paenibacillus sp. FSL A5-0031]|uniref:hypothetical protein n=1 Tax=Paenibacillus sp. FSL A5-0031 TaxID=1920420 RepID=UPI00096C8618|nr:hypothetical protein [Paenibacillus sp. FSL A5-0031]OME78725.1 hypothetical protein BK120_23625 [Paenibacillus sp. FSL A5-0031]
MSEPLLYETHVVPEETIVTIQARKRNANIYLLGPELIDSASVEEKLGQQNGKVIRAAEITLMIMQLPLQNTKILQLVLVGGLQPQVTTFLL